MKNDIATPVMNQNVQKALKKRTAILEGKNTPEGKTNALRLINGTFDGVPDVTVDTFAERWLVSTKTGQFKRFAK